MYLWQIEYNLASFISSSLTVVNRFKLCIFDRLNTTHYQIWIVFQYITSKFTIKNLYSILKSELKRFGLFWFYLVLFLSSKTLILSTILFPFLFFAAKRETEKLAAADKYAKIMIPSLNKKNSLRSNSFLFLTLQYHNFLTLFLSKAAGWRHGLKISGNIKVQFIG